MSKIDRQICHKYELIKMEIPKIIKDAGREESLLFFQLLEEAVLGDFLDPLADFCEEHDLNKWTDMLRTGMVPYYLRQMYYDIASPGHNVFYEMVEEAVTKNKNLPALAEACEEMGYAKEVVAFLKQGFLPPKIREVHKSLTYSDLEDMTDEYVVTVFRATPYSDRERMARLNKKATTFQKKLIRCLQGERRALGFAYQGQQQQAIQHWLRWEGLYSYNMPALVKYKDVRRNCEDAIRIFSLMGYEQAVNQLKELLKAARKFKHEK